MRKNGLDTNIVTHSVFGDFIERNVPFLLEAVFEILKKKFFFFNIVHFLRDRDSTSGGRTEREGDTESEAGFRL